MVQVRKARLWTADHVDVMSGHLTRQLKCEIRPFEIAQVAKPKYFQITLIRIRLPSWCIHSRVSDNDRHRKVFHKCSLLSCMLAKDNISLPQPIFIKLFVSCVADEQLLWISICIVC